MANQAQVRYASMAIDCDMNARMRLKQAASSVYQFKSIVLFGEMRDAREEITTSPNAYDVIFISDRISQYEISEFIKFVKSNERTQDAIFIQLQETNDNTDNKAAQSVFQGYDGSLMEPYSVEGLVTITELAAKLKKERLEAREKNAMDVILSDIIKSIDRIAFIKSCDMEPGRTVMRLKQTCEPLFDFDKRCKELYLDCAIDRFSKALATGNEPIISYKGASQRVKKLMIRRVLAEEESGYDPNKNLYKIFQKDK